MRSASRSPKLLPIPVYGIGAGSHTDGQLLICGDALGLFQAFTPKFVKKYANLAEDLRQRVQGIHRRRANTGKFPSKEHFYGMSERRGRRASSPNG